MYNSPDPPAPDRRMPESPPISEWWNYHTVDVPSFGSTPTESQNLANLALTLNQLSSDMVTQQRTGGGKGGGSEVIEKDPMETNRFVSMNLNPYLTDNVHSFKGGGKHGPYRYDGGGISMLKNPQGNTPVSRQVPFGQRMLAPGGHFANKANETIARAQLANMFVRKANKGMEYKYGGDYYKEGGNYPHNMYDPETGYKIVALNEGMHNKLEARGFTHSPKAAYGMKMKKKKRYTQGGRF